VSPATTALAAGTVHLGDLTVRRIGFGAGGSLVGLDAWGGPPDRMAAVAVIRRTVELGVNFIDTSDAYGPRISEELIAEALQPYPNDLIIATKGGFERSDTGGWIPNGTPQHLRAACEGSLRRLGLEQIPLYQLHFPDPKVPLEETIGAFVELQAEGKILHIGVCNLNADQLAEARQHAPIVCLQNRYNLADRRSDSLVDVCAGEGMAFLPWEPIRDLANVPAVAAMARNHDATVQQVALAWLLARSPAMLVIPSTSSVAHLETNVAAGALKLSADEVEALN
jgi:pyridoxine 4-dehydrogenase